MSKFHRTILQYSHWVRTWRTWKQTHKNNNAWYHDTHGTTSWVYLSHVKLSCFFFGGFLHHRWSLFSRGAIPSTQRLGHRNFHLHTWQQKLPAACKFREDFLTGSLKISPQKPTKKKTWHFSMYSSFRIWGTENGEPRCAHHETQARNPQQKNQKIWLEQQNIVFHLPNGNNLSFGHGWMSRLNNLAIFQPEFLWDGGDLSVFLGGEVDGCSFFKHLQSMGETPHYGGHT